VEVAGLAPAGRWMESLTRHCATRSNIIGAADATRRDIVGAVSEEARKLGPHRYSSAGGVEGHAERPMQQAGCPVSQGYTVR